MRQKNITWDNIVNYVKVDAEAKDYVVDFLDQRDSVDQTCYVYYKDDDQSAIYALNDQHRAQLEDVVGNQRGEVLGTVIEVKAQFAAQVADIFWSELNEHYRMTN